MKEYDMKKLILLGTLVVSSVFVGSASAVSSSRVAKTAVSELESRFDLSAIEAEELYYEVESLVEELKAVSANKVEIEQAVNMLVKEFKRELKNHYRYSKPSSKRGKFAKKQGGHGKLYNLVKYTLITLVTLYALKKACAKFAPELNAKIDAMIAGMRAYLSDSWNSEEGLFSFDASGRIFNSICHVDAKLAKNSGPCFNCYLRPITRVPGEQPPAYQVAQ
jgi:hypothetical protein